VSKDTVVWLPNALILTALLAAFAWWRWRSKGPVSGLRWTGVAMLPLALYAVGLFKLAWTVGLAFSRFVTGFVWRPSVWLGLVLVAIALALIVLPPKLDRRTGSSGPSKQDGSDRRRALGSSPKAAPADDEMAEIEDILKRHGLG
jgi:hypothetical protein